MNVVWYKTAEEVFDAYWQPIEPLGLRALDGASVCTQAADGEMVEVGADEALASIKDQGVWGFAATDDRVIHAWADESTEPAAVIHMLAHEIGHLTGTPEDDELKEELRADAFGEVAAQAYRLFAARSLLPSN